MTQIQKLKLGFHTLKTKLTKNIKKKCARLQKLTLLDNWKNPKK